MNSGRVVEVVITGIWMPTCRSGDVVGESSNVDFADEALTRLTSQRAYEANLKVVATAEEMTETLLDELG